MPEYQVVYPVRVPKRGIVREGTVELSERQAARALRTGSLRPASVAEPAPTDDERIQRIVAAIGELEPGNKDHWTKSGKPEVRALEEALGLNISAAERDAAWEQHQAAGGAEP